MRVIVIASLFVAMLLSLVLQNAGAADRAVRGPTTRPTTGPASGELHVKVIGIEGIVQVRASASEIWRKPLVGDELNAEAEVRIGPKSSILIRSGHGDKTIDRLGLSKVFDERGIGEKRTVGVPYRRKRYDIDEVGVEHTSELVSPSTTIAIRGDRVSFAPTTATAPSK